MLYRFIALLPSLAVDASSTCNIFASSNSTSRSVIAWLMFIRRISTRSAISMIEMPRSVPSTMYRRSSYCILTSTLHVMSPFRFSYTTTGSVADFVERHRICRLFTNSNPSPCWCTFSTGGSANLDSTLVEIMLKISPIGPPSSFARNRQRRTEPLALPLVSLNGSR
uniref:Putative secreted protein n=1 Tax=Anopheles darlingi TaxID=43151 RepID=A0A2M4DIH5_ANODA